MALAGVQWELPSLHLQREGHRLMPSAGDKERQAATAAPPGVAQKGVAGLFRRWPGPGWVYRGPGRANPISRGPRIAGLGRGRYALFVPDPGDTKEIDMAVGRAPPSRPERVAHGVSEVPARPVRLTARVCPWQARGAATSKVLTQTVREGQE